MSGRYIALVCADGGSAGASAALATLLRDSGLHMLASSDRTALYASPETRSVLFPGQAVVIGDVFDNTGRPIVDADALLRFSGGAELEAHLLKHCWGDYVLFQLGGETGSAVRVMREPTGGVACLYRIQNGQGFITSDISLAVALNLCSRRIDWSYVAHALAFPFLRVTRTGLVDVSELTPGCAMTIADTGIDVQQVWSPWAFVMAPARHHDPYEAALEIRSAVTTAVKSWASKEGGCILLETSGGLDSSIVAACLREAQTPVVCCTLVMPVSGTDERFYAQYMAEHLGVELQPVPVGLDQPLVDFPLPPEHVVPMIGMLHYAINLVWEASADRHGVTCCLSGAGGDTVFCYLKGTAPVLDALKERGWAAALKTADDLSLLHRSPFWHVAQLALKKRLRGAAPPWQRDCTFLNRNRLPDAPDPHPWFNAPHGSLEGDRERIFDLIGTQSYRESTPRGTGRSTRYPLASQPVIEACLRVPTWMWFADGRDRAVARAAFADVLPEPIYNRRSKGTYANYCGAVYERNKELIRTYLADGLLREQGLLDVEELDRFLSSPLAPRDMSFLRIMDLCMIENWTRRQG